MLLLVLTLEAASPTIDMTSSAVAECSTSPDDCADNNKDVPDWWYWPRRLFSIEDSIAQWIMMAFTVAAAILLFFTLRATQRMLVDGREIGVAQTRAYVSIGETEVSLDGQSLRFGLAVRNRGQSPARGLSVVLSHRWSQRPYLNPPQIGWASLKIAPRDGSKTDLGPSEPFFLHDTIAVPSEAFQGGSGSEFGIAISAIATYRDIYGRRRRTTFFGWVTMAYLEKGRTRLRSGHKHNRGS